MVIPKHCMVTIDFSLLKVVSLSYGADPKKLLFYKKESPDKADPIPKDEVTTICFSLN